VQHRGRLADGQYEGIEPREVARLPDRDDPGADPTERRRMRGEVALHGQDAGRHHPRSASRSTAGIVADAIPGIAAPRPRDAASTSSGFCQWVVARTIARARAAGSDLKMPDRRHGLRPERHVQARGVGRRRDAAGSEVRHRQPAALRQGDDQPNGAPSAWVWPSVRRAASARAPHLAPMRRVPDCLMMSPLPASPFVRIIARSSPIRRAPHQSRAPQTKGTRKACLSSWCSSSAGARTSLAARVDAEPEDVPRRR
jgi:hypothetical protein